jgi:hypothetical protein
MMLPETWSSFQVVQLIIHTVSLLWGVLYLGRRIGALETRLDVLWQYYLSRDRREAK